MNAADYISIPLRNVLRGRFRTALSVTAMAVGIASVLLLSAIGSTGKSLVNQQLESIGISGIMVFSGEYGGLSMADARAVSAKVREVTAAMPFDAGIRYYSFRTTSRAQATLMLVDENIGTFMNFDLIAGRLITENDCRTGKKVCMVDSTIAVENYKRTDITGKTVNITVDGVDQEFTVVGVIKSQLSALSGIVGNELPSFIYAPYTSVGEDPEKEASQLVFKVDQNADEALVKIRGVLKKVNQNGSYYQIENISGYREQLDKILDTVTAVLSATAAISLAVAGIGVMNTMFSAVNERRSEIGICMAIGARRSQIAATFLTESLFISLMGAAAGTAAGLFAAQQLCAAVGTKPEFTVAGIVFPAAATCATGLLSGIIPAIKASRMQPVHAIRKE